MKLQRQLFAKPRMSAAHRKALISAALLDYPIRQAAREEKRRVELDRLPIYRRRFHQPDLPFDSKPGWLTVVGPWRKT